jgi:hypothetical protein
MAETLNLPLDCSIATPSDLIVSELADRVADESAKQKFLDFASQYVSLDDYFVCLTDWFALSTPPDSLAASRTSSDCASTESTAGCGRMETASSTSRRRCSPRRAARP